MGKRKGKKPKLCLCSVCKDLFHLEDGEPHPGIMLNLREWKTHAADDQLREYRGEHLLYSSLVASVIDKREPSVAVRPRDAEHPEQEPLEVPSLFGLISIILSMNLYSVRSIHPRNRRHRGHRLVHMWETPRTIARWRSMVGIAV